MKAETNQLLLATRVDRQHAVDPTELTTIALDLESRQRSRQRLRLPDGRELAVALRHGERLWPGDQLHSECGECFQIIAAAEPVLRVRASQPLQLLQAAYHLGNRHCAVQLGADWLQLKPDPVLASMLIGLGLQVESVTAPFEPESGAYGGGHQHGHAATFAEDYALAQASFVLYEPPAGGLLRA